MAEGPIAPRLLLPDVPALVAGQGRAVVLDTDGSIETLPARSAATRLAESAPMLVHAPATARRLGVAGIGPAHDLLELFAFALPAASCAPTPRGLALALGLVLGHGLALARLAMPAALALASAWRGLALHCVARLGPAGLRRLGPALVLVLGLDLDP